MTGVSKTSFLQRLGGRQKRRINQYLYKITKDIIQKAKETKSALVLEDIKGIRKSYKKGNSQGNKFRRKLNSWSFYEFQRQIQHKAAWEGIRFHSLILNAPAISVQYAKGHSKRTDYTVVNCGALIV
jgi:IS605 OrfB family transposase